MNSKQIRVAFLGFAVASIPAVLPAQIQSDPMAPAPTGVPSRQTQNTNPSMQDSSPMNGMTGQMMEDRMFLRKAAEGGLAEVQLGQLAAEKAGSDDVKTLGQKMVNDHTAINQQMEPIADSMGVMLPKKLNKKDQAEYNKLNDLSGNNFDTEYLTCIVKDHHKDLHEFREEAATTADPTLRDVVTRAAGVIKQHIMMVDKLAQEKGIATPDHKNHAPVEQ